MTTLDYMLARPRMTSRLTAAGYFIFPNNLTHKKCMLTAETKTQAHTQTHKLHIPIS